MIIYYFLEGVVVLTVIVIMIVALTIFSEWLKSKIRCWHSSYNTNKKKEKDIAK